MRFCLLLLPPPPTTTEIGQMSLDPLHSSPSFSPPPPLPLPQPETNLKCILFVVVPQRARTATWNDAASAASVFLLSSARRPRL